MFRRTAAKPCVLRSLSGSGLIGRLGVCVPGRGLAFSPCRTSACCARARCMHPHLTVEVLLRHAELLCGGSVPRAPTAGGAITTVNGAKVIGVLEARRRESTAARLRTCGACLRHRVGARGRRPVVSMGGWAARGRAAREVSWLLSVPGTAAGPLQSQVLSASPAARRRSRRAASTRRSTSRCRRSM